MKIYKNRTKLNHFSKQKIDSWGSMYVYLTSVYRYKSMKQ